MSSVEERAAALISSAKDDSSPFISPCAIPIKDTRKTPPHGEGARYMGGDHIREADRFLKNLPPFFSALVNPPTDR
jgi:hypothetical protein